MTSVIERIGEIGNAFKFESKIKHIYISPTVLILLSVLRNQMCCVFLVNKLKGSWRRFPWQWSFHSEINSRRRKLFFLSFLWMKFQFCCCFFFFYLEFTEAMKPICSRKMRNKKKRLWLLICCGSVDLKLCKWHFITIIWFRHSTFECN